MTNCGWVGGVGHATVAGDNGGKAAGARIYCAKQKGRGFRPGLLLFPTPCLCAEQQDACGLVFSDFADWPVEELVVFEVDL